MNLPQTSNRPHLIAGQRCGKPVALKAQLIPAYNRLQAAARSNYWAHVALEGLHALQTGVIGKDNIYVKDSGFPRGLQQFRVLLPGLVVKVELGRDGFNVTSLKLSEAYFVAKNRHKTGIHRVTQDLQSSEKQWNTEYVKDGKVLYEKGRVVAVADSGHDTAGKAAVNCARRLPAAPDVGPGALARDGFDMHFTAGPKRLGGWTRYNALHSAVDSTYQSAFLLADAMQKAKATVGVQWVSVYGGSEILTQAMKILVDRGVTLERHTAFLCNPRTSPGQAVQLAHKLQLQVNENFADTGFDPRGALSSLSLDTVTARIGDQNDNFGWQHGLTGASSYVFKTLSLLGAGAYVAGEADPAVFALSGIVGAIGYASTAASAAESTGKLAKELYESNRHKLTTRK